MLFKFLLEQAKKTYKKPKRRSSQKFKQLLSSQNKIMYDKNSKRYQRKKVKKVLKKFGYIYIYIYLTQQKLSKRNISTRYCDKNVSFVALEEFVDGMNETLSQMSN
ncbi:MAG: hypothetical protein MJZ24_04670 [Paludibacteraceae bacterium]|nr:hypothetical protein [Paludibacteraceae bacterium]